LNWAGWVGWLDGWMVGWYERYYGDEKIPETMSVVRLDGQ